MTDIRCDVLIVGSGAAGATIAATLAEYTKLSVVLVEKGPYYGAEFFNQRELDMMVLLAQNGGRSTVDGSIPVAGGECVGGGTTVNYALAFDPIPEVWNRWRQQYGLQGFSFAESANDYGIEGLNLAAALSDVRKRCNVHAPEDSEVNDNNRLFANGCQRLGVSAKKYDLNMQGCIGCGFCGQGCAYDAKRGTMVTYLEDALHAGVRLIHHCSIDQIHFDSAGSRLRAVGASGTVATTRPGSRPNSVASGPISIDARLVIVSAGTIESPGLLQRSHVPDPFDRIGRGLVLHPSLPIAGVFDREIVNYRGITGSYYSDYFYAEHGFMLECLFDHPIDAAIALPGFGLDHFDLMRDYGKLAGFGAMLVDTPSDNNRVVWSVAGGAPQITYRLSVPDKARLRFAASRMVEIMFASGAREAILTSHEPLTPRGNAIFQSASEAGLCERLAFAPNETLVSSAHAQASVKMSEDPRFGMANSRGEVHGVRGVIVCDSSAFPTSCGANPMIAIMSLARYQGRRIAGEQSRYFARA
jgi:choline dehydrogenase-like flavoprotein